VLFMLTKDNLTIGIEWRFGLVWPGQRCGAKTCRGAACQCPVNKKNGRCQKGPCQAKDDIGSGILVKNMLGGPRLRRGEKI